jgi:tyrosyl-tRNA synthetase
MRKIFEELRERGFIKASTDETALIQSLNEPSVLYTGFDPTATSLHVGSLVPIMAMAHFQRAGHFPLALIDGATAYIGDPSGKTELRKMLSSDDIDQNVAGIRKQLSHFLTLDGKKGDLVNNADWFLPMGYIEFLREIGTYFRVNDMLRSESCKSRLDREDGLSFLEFNYQILQGYDFLYLSRKYNCTIQLGGNDQWGNIVAGTQLVRRKDAKQVFGLTFPLLQTASGKKMGKTEQGAVWLDPIMTSPYDYYQYWINVEDADVERFLKLYTFLSLSDIAKIVVNDDVRDVKKLLAFETTKLAHGLSEATAAQSKSEKLFSASSNVEEMATNATEVLVSIANLSDKPLVDIVFAANLESSKTKCRQLILQQSIQINGKKLSGSLDEIVVVSPGQSILVQKGKKIFVKVIFTD